MVHVLALVMENQGNVQRAKEGSSKALSIFQKRLGPDHPHTQLVDGMVRRLT